MSSMVGPWRLATMWGFLRATLPMETVTMSIYVTPVASSWTMWVVYIISTVGPANVSGCLVSEGASREAGDGESLSRHATTPLKPGGSAISGLGSGDPGNDVELDFCSACFGSLTCWCWALLPTLWLLHHCLSLPRVRGVHPVEITSQAGCSTSVQPGNVAPWNFHLFLFPHATKGGYLTPQLAH